MRHLRGQLMRQSQMDMSYDDGIVERDVARQKLRTDQRRIQYARGKAGLLETQRWLTNPFPRSDNERDRRNRVAAYERYIVRLTKQDARATHDHQPGQTGYLPCR